MSNERTQAIHKAATELVAELLQASLGDGGERWLDIIVRKMERLPCAVQVNPNVNPKSLLLRVGQYELGRLGDVVLVKRINRNRGVQVGGDHVFETDRWGARDLARLKLWLDGE